MAFLIDGPSDHTRIANSNLQLGFSNAYFGPMARGEPIAPELLARTPDIVPVEGPDRGSLPDFWNQRAGAWIISSRARSAIEELEPNTHVFIPIRAKLESTGQVIDGQHILYIGQVINAVIVDETDFVGGFGTAGFVRSPYLKQWGDIVLRKHQIANKHLWRGGRSRLGEDDDPFWPNIFCSDTLANKIKSEPLDGWYFRECIERN